jgi:hypothetical protein
VLNEIEPALGEHGDGPGRGNKRVDNIKSFNQGGTDATYLLKRLKRYCYLLRDLLPKIREMVGICMTSWVFGI